MADFVQRLRRRKLVQWALAYLAAAFALIQVLEIVAQHFGWPEPAMRIAIIGRKDQAIDLLQQLFASPAGHVISPALLKIDPIWDPLRGDARFEKLVNDSYKPFEPTS
jgi:hypothetical protein